MPAFRSLSRMALILLAAATTATTTPARDIHHVVYRLGPSLCKEGPPAWTAPDGRQIMYRTWQPAQGEPRAIIVGVPGWNATAGDIEPLARYLAARGIAVYSCGVRGQHGDLTAKSRHLKGDILDGRLWTEDFCGFADWVRREHPRTPLFLYGQSMGALIALTAADREADISGIILHSPAVAMIYTPLPVRSFIGLMRALVGDRLLFNVGLIPGDKPALTSDAAFDRVWGLSVDRVRPGFTWRFLDESLKLGERARGAAEHLRIPVLVLTGDQDPIGTAGVGQHAFAKLMTSIPSSDKERIRFSNGYHDLIHDENKPQALRCVAYWMDRKLGVSQHFLTDSSTSSQIQSHPAPVVSRSF